MKIRHALHAIELAPFCHPEGIRVTESPNGARLQYANILETRLARAMLGIAS
ncbi:MULTISPECIES: hypothetical protein [Asaia]|uniref:hypothetical protein n=1 Tax=Asaia TaxID=91914 RepID=UPI000A8BDDC8|nr:MULTISPECIES: hypothetical protein [Asaia]